MISPEYPVARSHWIVSSFDGNKLGRRMGEFIRVADDLWLVSSLWAAVRKTHLYCDCDHPSVLVASDSLQLHGRSQGSPPLTYLLYRGKVDCECFGSEQSYWSAVDEP